MHGDEQLSLRGLADLVHGADVHVLQLSRGSGLHQEPLLGLRVVAQHRGKELERHDAAQAEVARASVPQS